jgi:beta-galactosidase/beta-glucuronidase
MNIRSRAAIVVLLLSLTHFALAAPPPGRTGRAIQLLSGEWQFRTDPKEEGLAAGWAKSVATGAEVMVVPNLWNRADRTHYQGVAWYWRQVTVPNSWKDQTMRLGFGAVASRATVWIDGNEVGTHSDPVTPFSFNVTKLVKPGVPFLVAVRVESGARDGGIWQDVRIIAHDEAYISDYVAGGDAYGNLAATIHIENTSNVTGTAVLAVAIISETDPKHPLKATEQIVDVSPGLNVASFNIEARSRALHLWSPASHTLYHCSLHFRQGNDVLDSVTTIIGFRQFGYAGGEVQLNGASVMLHPAIRGDIPAAPVVTPDEVAHERDILEHLSASGVNLIALAAPNPAVLNIADELGIMVIEGPDTEVPAATRQKELRDLIARDRSHPCILGWWAESADADALRQIRQLDSNRFVIASSSMGLKMAIPGDDGLSSDANQAIVQIINDYAANGR